MFLTTAVTIPIYATLERRGRLASLKASVARMRKGRVLTCAGAAVITGVAVAAARHVDFPPLRRGIPGAIQSSITRLSLHPTNSIYYCLGSFIDSEWIWQAELSNGELNRLAEELGMKPVGRKELADTFQKKPPYWWHPRITEKTTMFSTMNFPMHGRGGDGWHAFAIWNPEDQIICMWIKDNF